MGGVGCIEVNVAIRHRHAEVSSLTIAAQSGGGIAVALPGRSGRGRGRLAKRGDEGKLLRLSWSGSHS
jgi:hypothetical protein